MGMLNRFLKNFLIQPPHIKNDHSLRLFDVSSSAAEIDLAHLEVIRWAPVWMTGAERLLLYTLIFALRPSRYLEIGTLKGGSALIAAAAMNAVESDGRIICVDPKPQIAPEHWEQLKKRTKLIKGYSPGALSDAYEIAGGAFDFVLIDGDHTYSGVLRDANGVMPYVVDGAYLLFHDSLFADVSRGLQSFAQQNANQIVDFGTLTREVTYQDNPPNDPQSWGGLRLMQVRRKIIAI